jgi:hypothetical protein
LYRSLAQERPDAFLPDLAFSVGLQASVLTQTGELSQAISASTEALRLLAPAFLNYPVSLVDRARWLLQIHVALLKKCRAELDPDLVDPYVRYFDSQKDRPNEPS